MRSPAGHGIVRSRSRYGNPIQLKDASLPRIDDNVLDTAIYLYPDVVSAISGSSAGGSGFLVNLPIPDKPDHSYVVAISNRHVVENGNPVVRLNTKDGFTAVYDLLEPSWVMHDGGQDLAAHIIKVDPERQKFRGLGVRSILTKERSEELDVGPGTDVFMVGRFIHQDGNQSNVPTVRFGTIAQMPSIVTDSATGRGNESYIVECRSIGGFSGSPIYLHAEPGHLNNKTQSRETRGYSGYLVAVDWAHSGQTEFVYNALGEETQMYVESSTGLAMAIPSWRLLELLNDPNLLAQIDRIERGEIPPPIPIA